nr:putative alpha/beta hydrolase fold protein [Tanacetum cinerariifolium]
MECKASDASSRSNNLLNLRQLDSSNGNASHPSEKMLKRSDEYVDSSSGLDLQNNIAEDKGINRAVTQTDAVGSEVMKEGDVVVDAETGQVVRATEVAMNMLDVTMLETLSEEQKLKVRTVDSNKPSTKNDASEPQANTLGTGDSNQSNSSPPGKSERSGNAEDDTNEHAKLGHEGGTKVEKDNQQKDAQPKKSIPTPKTEESSSDAQPEKSIQPMSESASSFGYSRIWILASMGDTNDAWGMGHVSTITDKEGSMPSTSMDLQDDNSKSNIEEYDNGTTQFMASSYKRHGGRTNNPSLHELDEYYLYDGYDDVVSDLTEEQTAFCNAFDINVQGQIRR